MATPALGSIGAVVDRIQSIEARFAPDRADRAVTVQTGAPFDPFGEAYQRAVETRSVAPTATTDPTAARLIERPGSIGTVGTTGSSHVHGGGYGSMPIPPVLAPYGNGRIPESMLTPIEQSGHRLYAPAAASWDRLVDAAAEAGFDLRITDSYRSYDQQVDLAARKGLYSEGGLAAKPGTSNHGWGLAVDADVRDPALLGWLREHGPEFGWVESVPREPWHWEFRPHQV